MGVSRPNGHKSPRSCQCHAPGHFYSAQPRTCTVHVHVQYKCTRIHITFTRFSARRTAAASRLLARALPKPARPPVCASVRPRVRRDVDRIRAKARSADRAQSRDPPRARGRPPERADDDALAAAAREGEGEGKACANRDRPGRPATVGPRSTPPRARVHDVRARRGSGRRRRATTRGERPAETETETETDARRRGRDRVREGEVARGTAGEGEHQDARRARARVRGESPRRLDRRRHRREESGGDSRARRTASRRAIFKVQRHSGVQKRRVPVRQRRG